MIYSPLPPNLDTIKFADVTNSRPKSPKTLTAVLQEVPRDILVQDEHTGAIKCRAPGQLCRASRIASLIAEREREGKREKHNSSAIAVFYR